MTTQVQEAQDLYNYLKPVAIRSARSYVMVRTPHHLQDEMAVIIDADIPKTERAARKSKGTAANGATPPDRSVARREFFHSPG